MTEKSNDDRAKYRRRYLAENAAARERNLMMGKAQRQAQRDVVNNHYEEYRERLEIRREELGLERGGQGRPPKRTNRYTKAELAHGRDRAVYERWKKGKK